MQFKILQKSMTLI